MSSRQRITPYLWFDDDAERGNELLGSIFKNSKILENRALRRRGTRTKGTVMCGTFQHEGQQFIAQRRTPHTDVISLFVTCESRTG